MGFVDLHSHVLPGIDDGAPDEVTSTAMLRGLAAIGFDTVCATPHQYAARFMPSREQIDAAHDATRQRISDLAIPLDLPLAAENMWDTVFFERAQAAEIPAYGNGPAFLMEWPTAQVPVGLFEQLFEWQRRGTLPVLAHPERYRPLWKDWELVERLRQYCALVVDLGAVAGRHGRKPGKLARKLLKEGVAHAVASDAHTVADVAIAESGIAWIRDNLGPRAVTRLLDDNPRRIVAGEHPDG